jgi:hypothetical protein
MQFNSSFFITISNISKYILNLDDNQNQKVNVKTGFLVWMDFIWVSLFVSWFLQWILWGI